MQIKGKGEDCPLCDNVGWVVNTNCSSLPWEATQEQCRWCYTNPNSKFNQEILNDKIRNI